MSNEKHTPGPWRWFGNLKTKEIYLATVAQGRIFVMDFARWGMQGAQPRFRREFMRGVDQVAVREVAYRGDIARIDHPDARLIETAPELLAAAEECALWFGPFTTARFEEAAERFQRETGYMAPGSKDVAAAMHPGDEWEKAREPAWRAWSLAQIEAARVALQAAIAKARGE